MVTLDSTRAGARRETEGCRRSGGYRGDVPARSRTGSGAALVALVATLLLLTSACRDSDEHESGPSPATTAPEATPPPPNETTRPEEPPPATESPPTEPTTPEPTPPPPPQVPFSWASAGTFVWHENDVDPALLGTALRQAGFGWVAVFLHDGMTEDPVEADWVYRFRLASGLPIGGWGVLRTEPESEAELAHTLVGRYGLDFYVANPEVEFEFSGPDGPSPERSGRSRRFVDRFRALLPSTPAGVSSYCRPDRHDIDWTSWRQAGFAFLPQAYVNDLGQDVSPARCVAGAASFFPRTAVHPMVGMHVGVRGTPGAADYVELLAQAGTLGFSVYLAETRMTDDEWRVFGEAIASRGIAAAA